MTETTSEITVQNHRNERAKRQLPVTSEIATDKEFANSALHPERIKLNPRPDKNRNCQTRAKAPQLPVLRANARTTMHELNSEGNERMKNYRCETTADRMNHAVLKSKVRSQIE